MVKVFFSIAFGFARSKLKHGIIDGELHVAFACPYPAFHSLSFKQSCLFSSPFIGDLSLAPGNAEMLPMTYHFHFIEEETGSERLT